MRHDVYEGLHLFNDSVHKAVLSLGALATHAAFDKSEVNRFADYMQEVRSRTNGYLLDIIRANETEQAVNLLQKRNGM